MATRKDGALFDIIVWHGSDERLRKAARAELARRHPVEGEINYIERIGTYIKAHTPKRESRRAMGMRKPTHRWRPINYETVECRYCGAKLLLRSSAPCGGRGNLLWNERLQSWREVAHLPECKR